MFSAFFALVTVAFFVSIVASVAANVATIHTTA
jgi:hypothetical protein